jgi:hypothetical protein
MVTVIDPEGTIKDTISESQLTKFLSEHGMEGAKVPHLKDTVVAFAPAVAKVISSLDAHPATLIEGFVSEARLIDEMRRRLSTGENAVFSPTMKGMRHFLNTKGFVFAMRRVAETIDGTTIIPPGIYGARHYFGVAVKSGA